MKLLVIGTDRELFRPDSAARQRIAGYASLFDTLDIVVMTPPGFSETAIAANARIFPTNSRQPAFRPFDAARIARALLKKTAIDCVSAQDPAESGLAGWLTVRRTRVPLHVQLHADFFAPAFRRQSIKDRLRFWIARYVIRRAARFRVVSERIKRSLVARGISEGRIRVLPIFVDRSAIAAAAPAFDLHAKFPQYDWIVLFAARLVREKNIPLALEAFTVLCKEFPRSGMVVVGDGPERERLLGVERVEFLGWQDDLLPYYKGTDCFLLTSNHEGYNRGVIEAAAAGLPVIMTDVGIAGEIIQDQKTGRVVLPGSAAALGGALIAARREGEWTKTMAAEAQRVVLAMEPGTEAEYRNRYRESFV
ncbi:glycosyltransferase [Candidatus Parcubacteria bacterium]|nr:MAG: glycosyltransferase [Candidatus Parcubacteria bacterium]